MEREPDASEDFDPRLRWPYGAAPSPPEPASGAPTWEAEDSGTDGALVPDDVDDAAVLGVDAAVRELTVQFQSLADQVAAFHDGVADHLAHCASELEAMEMLTAGSLEGVHKAYQGVLSALRHRFAGRPDAPRWLDKANADMWALVDAVARLRDTTAEQTRALVATGGESAHQLTESVRRLGERLGGDMTAVEDAVFVQPPGGPGQPDRPGIGRGGNTQAWSALRKELDQSLSRLVACEQARAEAPPTLDDVAQHQRATERRLQVQLEGIGRELRALAKRDEQHAAAQARELEERLDARVLQLAAEMKKLRTRDDKAIKAPLTRLADEVMGVRLELDSGMQPELIRLSHEVQALRRRLNRMMSGGGVQETHIEELANAVAAALGASPDASRSSGGGRRRPRPLRSTDDR